MSLWKSLRCAGAIAIGIPFAALVSGCAAVAVPAGEGVARVAVTLPEASAPGVGRVTVTISGGDGTAFPSISLDLSASGASWSGSITGVPAGPGRRFDAVALDADGRTLYSGSARSDIVAGASALVSAWLGAPPPSPYGNSVPVIDFLAVSAVTVTPAGTAWVWASAHDPDAGDVVSYLWTSTCGAFDAPSSAQALWTAPAASGASCDVAVLVTDGKGGSIAATVTVAVATSP